jgi:hypothetical protein
MLPKDIEKKIESVVQSCKETTHAVSHIDQILSRLDPNNKRPEHSDEGSTRNGTGEDSFWKKFPIADRIQSVIGVLLLVTVVYAVRSFNLTNQEFTRDQRPYIWITRPSFDPVRAGTELTGRVTFRNFGKSPALNIRNDISNIYIGRDAMKSVDTVLSTWKTLKIVHGGNPAITLPPENPQDPESYLSTTVVGWIFGRGPGPISADDENWISTHAGGAIMAGNIQYTDMAGNAYYTEYCVYRLVDGHTAPCATHNEIH